MRDPGSPLPEIEPIAFLLGTWRGRGHGGFPTIEPFDYGEVVTFEHVGDAFVLIAQQSWSSSDGAPLHFERGFLRPGRGPGIVELTLAHPLGLTEIGEGRVEGSTLELTSTAVGRTSTGMDVTDVVRRYRVAGDRMHIEMDMATERTPLTRHLTAVLCRDLE